MVSTFNNPVISRASQLGVSLFEETEPIEMRSGFSSSEIEIVIRAVYRQVLGNAHVMESERLTVPESQLKQGDISVREFVRQVAKSELYRSRFFDNCPRYRFIELNFKHLLGRAPESYEEMTEHSQLLDRGGFEAEIDSYIDSEEYQNNFGENLVPYYRGYKTQTGKKIVGFTHLFQLLRGASSSDKNLTQGNFSRLNQSLIANTPSTVVPPSSIRSYGGLTDVNKLLAEVLKPKLPVPVSTTEEAIARSQAYQALQRQCQEQEKLIETLQQQLAELQPFAAIGQRQLSKWLSYSRAPNGGGAIKMPGTVEEAESYQALQRLSQEQEEAISALREQIAESRRFATIGEARLNKWRSRTFSR